MQRISIIGLGVIGGSLGLAIKQNNPRATVVGFDTPHITAQARRRKAIDTAAHSLTAAVAQADIVFLCTPVSTILTLMPKIARVIQPHAIVTDVGSVKGAVHEAAKKYFREKGIFAGGHPMTGSEGSGINFADPLLFQNAAYVLCPLNGGRKKIQPLISLITSIGARILVMHADEHDKVAAAVSHLPQLIAIGMMDLAGRKNSSNAAFLQLAAGGFRDITRIASSPFPMWKDILYSNRKEVTRVLKEFQNVLIRFGDDINGRSSVRIGRQFHSAKKLRDAIPKNSKGFLHPLHDIVVRAEDKPGTLAKIASVLFRANININDIELIKVREGLGGTFRLSFESADAASKAMRVLRRNKFKLVH